GNQRWRRARDSAGRHRVPAHHPLAAPSVEELRSALPARGWHGLGQSDGRRVLRNAGGEHVAVSAPPTWVRPRHELGTVRGYSRGRDRPRDLFHGRVRNLARHTSRIGAVYAILLGTT